MDTVPRLRPEACLAPTQDACSRRDGQAEALCNALPKTPTAIQKVRDAPIAAAGARRAGSARPVGATPAPLADPQDAARTLTCDEVCVNDREDRWENIGEAPAR